MVSDIDLVVLQAAIGFRYDPRGRLVAINEAEPDRPAPRLFMGRTRTGNVWRFRYDLPDSLVGELEGELRAEPAAADLTQPPAVLPALIDALAPIQDISLGPAWRFPEDPKPLEETVAITQSNVAACRSHFPWTASHVEDLQPCRAVIVDGEAVSLCFSSRNGPAAAAAGIFTLEAFRGRGYAARVVIAWAIAVREQGRIPLYSTLWNNVASRAVAHKLGLILYAADLSIS